MLTAAGHVPLSAKSYMLLARSVARLIESHAGECAKARFAANAGTRCFQAGRSC